MDDTWGEGGVALDKDEKILSWFGFDDSLTAELFPVFQELMSALWSHLGWTVKMVDDMPDIAEAVGVDRSVCEAPRIPVRPIPLENIGVRFAKDGRLPVLVTVIRDGEIEDRGLDLALAPVLVNGPAFLETLEALPLMTEAEEVSSLWGGCVVDFSTQTLSHWKNWGADDMLDAEPLWAKADWTLSRLEPGGLEHHFDRLGRATPEALIPPPREPTPQPEPLAENDALEQLAAILLGSEREDPSRWMARCLVQMESELEAGGTLHVHPHALTPKPSGPDDDAQWDRFELAVRCYKERTWSD